MKDRIRLATPGGRGSEDCKQAHGGSKVSCARSGAVSLFGTGSMLPQAPRLTRVTSCRDPNLAPASEFTKGSWRGSIVLRDTLHLRNPASIHLRPLFNRLRRGMGGFTRRSCSMSGALWILLLACQMALGGCSTPLREGDEAPPFRLDGMEGGSVSLEALRGRVVVLHFWATWCPPCLEELPRLLTFFRKQDPDRFVLVAVNVDKGDPARVREFLGTWGLEHRGYLDPGGRLARRYGTIRFPETYALDRHGVLRMKVVGASDWSDPSWERFLQNCYEGAEPRG